MSKGTAILKKFTGKTSKPRTSLAEASPVSPSALPENERERTTSAGYGLSLRGAFAYFDRGTSSWRTPQGCLVWASDTFSETWPPSGMMRNGIVYPRPRLVPRTSVTGYGLWPTPRGADVSGGDRTKWVAEGRWQMGLREAVRMFPTPAAADGERGSETYCRGNPTLLGAVRMWLTPSATNVDSRSEDAVRRRTEYRKSIGRETVPPGCLAEQVKAGYPTRDIRMWPTPSGTAGEGEFLETLETKDGEPAKQYERAYNPETGKHVQITLNRAVKLWPTPKGSPSGPDFARANREGSGGDDLATAAARWPTPTNSMQTTGDLEQARYSSRNRPAYQEVNTGQLNPTWVEWLMGYPLGWTDLNVSATP